MPRIRLADTSRIRNKGLAQLKGLRRIRKTTRFLLYLTCVCFALDAIPPIIYLYSRSWSKALASLGASLGGCWLFGISIWILVRDLRKIHWEARKMRVQLGILKKMECIDISINMGIEGPDVEEKPKIH